MAILEYIFNIAFLYQVIASLIVYAILRSFIFFRTRHRRFKLLKDTYGIGGFKPALYDGNINLWQSIPFSGDLVDEGRRLYGNLISFFTGDEPSIFMADADLIKKIFIDYSHVFSERGYRYLNTPLFKGLFYAKYPRWKEQRRIMSQPFNGYAVHSDSSAKFIQETTKLMLEYIEEKRSKLGSDVQFDIKSLMKATALHLISAIAIKLPNVKVCENEPHVISLDAFMESMAGGCLMMAARLPFIKGLITFLANHFENSRALGQVRQSVVDLVEVGKKELKSGTWDAKKRTHVIDSLIKMHYHGKLSYEEVIGNVETILVAGYDTTSTTLTYIFWTLAKETEVQTKLRSDLMAYGTESKYLEQIINEVMRLYPTLLNFTTRLAMSSVKINGQIIPQGARAVHHTWLMHRNPDLWDQPDKFDPSRFEEPEKIHPCAFAPFGLGEKKCLGWQLAMMEMKQIVCDIVLRYKVILIGPQKMELVNYGPVMTQSKETVMVRFEKIH